MSVARALRAGWRPGGLYRLGTASGPARYRVVRADAGARRLVVGLHGFGADERQTATMLPLDLGGAVYLALRAPDALGDGGFSWFGLDLDDLGRPAPTLGGAERAARHVRAFAWAAQRAWGTDQTALVGYSQGGAVALAVALGDAGPFAAVASLAGGVPAAGGPRPHPAPPLFVGWGTLDPAVPAADVERAVGALGGAGGVTACPARAPHVVTHAQREALSAWLRDHL